MAVVSLPPWAQRGVVVAAVLLDLLAVSLVVPLLPARFRELGVSQRAYGAISSTYSAAQILGGLALGGLSDRGLGRRGLLLLSFVGAAVSYALVGAPGASLQLLVFSRVLVGLCKQTMTASTALIAELTGPGGERVAWIGRVSSAATLAWIAGQSVGGLLNAAGDPRRPAAVAVALYAADVAMVLLFLPSSSSPRQQQPEEEEEKNPAVSPPAGAWARVRHLLSSREVGRVVAVRLALSFVQQAAGVSRTLYELERWDLTRADAAYLSSFKSLVGVASSWYLAGALTRSFGVATLARGATLVLALAALLEAVPAETWRASALLDALLARGFCADPAASLLAKACRDPSLLVYAALAFPASAAAAQVLGIALRSRFTEVVPRADTASALASLDVLMSAVGVAAPLVGGAIYDGLKPYQQPLLTSALYAAALLLVLALMRVAPGKDRRGFVYTDVLLEKKQS